jgi:SAM-dependent methyltransferase
MAIDALYLSYLKQAIDGRRAAGGGARLRGLFLAYPDLLVPRAALVQILGEAAIAGVGQRSDAASIWTYHGLADVADPMYDSLAILDRLGVDATVIDAAKLRGMERIVDLNFPLPGDLARSFDLVVDTGTCEHCFNVAQAFVNACEALAAGGMLVHAAPLTRINHGFWSFNPTIYPDFFEDNGFDLHLLTGVTGTIVQGLRPFAVEPFGRFEAPNGAGLYVVAERREVMELRWPVQRKYRQMLK